MPSSRYLEKLKEETAVTLRLAIPLILAEIGWMMMNIVDVMMVGRLPESAAAIGGTSIGSALFYTVAIFAEGLLLGMDPLIAQSFGANRISDCNRTFFASIILVLLLSPVLVTILYLIIPLLPMFGIHPAVYEQSVGFLKVMAWSIFPMLLFFALRHYLQNMSYVKAIMFTLISANIINIFFNWVLIYGNLGAPQMGIVGSAWATFIARVYMLVVLVVAVLHYNRREKLYLKQTPLRFEWGRIYSIIKLGLPAAMHIVLEISAFAVAAVLIGRLGPVPLAAHQTALSVVGFTYMIPLGISGAAAVRVGQAIGRKEPKSAAYAGWIAIMLGVAFMSLAAITLWTVPRLIIRIFTPDEQIIHAGIAILFVAAFFQLFDGLQSVATGALRGTAETRIPMITVLFAYWAIGIPLGYHLCFHRGLGAAGLWMGLSIALILIGIVLTIAWSYRVKHLRSMAEEIVIKG